MKNILSQIRVKNQVCLITGSSGYLGREFAMTLAEMGFDLILTDRNLKEIIFLKKKIKKNFKIKVSCKSCNLLSLKSRASLIKFVRSKTNKLHLIVNNAGLTGIKEKFKFNKKKSLKIQSVKNFNEHLEVNLTSVFHLIKDLSDLLFNSKKGKIINIGSIYASVAPKWDLYNDQKMNNRAGYSASKAGLLHLTKWFATNLAPYVRVNMISPGGIFRGHNKKFLNKYNSQVPLKRMANIKDINGTLIYLASDLSQYVTGQNLIVDGGWTIS